jgi:heptosyltransferase-2
MTEASPLQIGVLLPNWIGDVVMATPALRALRDHFGTTARITGIMRPYVARVLDGTDFLDQQIFYDRRSPDPARKLKAVSRQLKQQGLEMMLLMPNSFSAAMLAWRSGARQRIGFARRPRGWLLSRRLRLPMHRGKPVPRSAIDHYLDVIRAAGVTADSRQMELATLPEDEAGADQAWHALGLGQAGRVVVFNTGSANGSARNWPLEYFTELAQRLVATDSELAVLVICGPAETESAAAIEAAADHPRIRSMVGQDLSLGVAKACVRRAQLMITTDSGPRHFAPAFNVPAISLAGPIDPRWSESHHRHSISLQHPVDCGPCGLTVCPLDYHACMRDLSVDRVEQAARDKLNRSTATGNEAA